jgi:hypothetical protein
MDRQRIRDEPRAPPRRVLVDQGLGFAAETMPDHAEARGEQDDAGGLGNDRGGVREVDLDRQVVMPLLASTTAAHIAPSIVSSVDNDSFKLAMISP